jgi:fatty acid desaturase
MKVQNRTERRSLGRIHRISRAMVCLVVASTLGSLFWQPAGPVLIVVDVLARAYLMFLGCVMAHEASHGHLGATRAANFWWGRLALIPVMVPYTNLRKTHHLHHAHTNIPERDPDYYMRPRHPSEIPWRAVAMAHQWLFWLWSRRRLSRADLLELALNYAAILAVYALLIGLAGAGRVAWGMAPALLLNSILLWYPFAILTHEGYSTGPAEGRSHNYYGWFMYWFSLSLSLHRAHHLRPELTWLELKAYVEEAPGANRRPLPPGSDPVGAG